MNFGELIAKGGALFARKGADALADTLETAPPADLARIQASVSGADYIAGVIGGFTASQTATAKLPKFFTATANQGVAVTYGALSLRLGTIGGLLSMEYAFDHAGTANVISKLTASSNSSGYIYNSPYTANTFAKAQVGLNITDAGAMQEVTIADVSGVAIYVCILLVGPGGANNFFSIDKIQ